MTRLFARTKGAEMIVVSKRSSDQYYIKMIRAAFLTLIIIVLSQSDASEPNFCIRLAQQMDGVGDPAEVWDSIAKKVRSAALKSFNSKLPVEHAEALLHTILNASEPTGNKAAEKHLEAALESTARWYGNLTNYSNPIEDTVVAIRLALRVRRALTVPITEEEIIETGYAFSILNVAPMPRIAILRHAFVERCVEHGKKHKLSKQIWTAFHTQLVGVVGFHNVEAKSEHLIRARPKYVNEVSYPELFLFSVLKEWVKTPGNPNHLASIEFLLEYSDELFASAKKKDNRYPEDAHAVLPRPVLEAFQAYLNLPPPKQDKNLLQKVKHTFSVWGIDPGQEIKQM